VSDDQPQSYAERVLENLRKSPWADAAPALFMAQVEVTLTDTLAWAERVGYVHRKILTDLKAMRDDLPAAAQDLLTEGLETLQSLNDELQQIKADKATLKVRS
jgi:hypothetical protein